MTRPLLFALGALALVALGAPAQNPPPASAAQQAAAALADRYGVRVSPVAFPQKTVPEAITSLAKAVEKGRADYLAAHLVLPTLIDARVLERSKKLELGIDGQLRAKRDSERAAPPASVDAETRVPLDAIGFQAEVERRAQAAAFVQVAQSIRTYLADKPAVARELREYALAGTVSEVGDTATVSRPGTQKLLRLVRLSERWFLDDSPPPPADNPAK